MIGAGLGYRRRGPRLHQTTPDRSDRYSRQKLQLALISNVAGNHDARRRCQRRSRHGAERAMLREQPGLGLPRGITGQLTAQRGIATRLIQDKDRECRRQQNVAQQCDKGEPDNPRSASSTERRNAVRIAEQRMCHPVNQPCILP
jgi:hypothetical protein